MLVIAAPGQGAQTPGFLTPWLDLPGVPDRLAEWSELAGCDLIRCGTTADADEITDTSVAQPLLVAAGLAIAEAAFGGPDGPARVAQATAGHSVGELTAGAIAGVLSPADAMRLVRVRGRAMAQAAGVTPTGMTAVMGGDEEQVLASLSTHGLTPANINGAGQIVAAGTLEQLSAFAADPPGGARLRPLRVAGAFHTMHMAPAVEALRRAAAGVKARDPRIILLSNRDGSAVSSGADWLERIVSQVSAPVRWDACLRSMASLGVTALIELPPAGTLTGLARRVLPGVALLAIKRPDDLAAARTLAAEHGSPASGQAAGGVTPAGRSQADGRAEDRAADGGWSADEADGHVPGADGHHPEWRLLVAPVAGTFRAGSGVAPGTRVTTGAELGRVEARADRRPITPPCPGAIIEWLVEDGDPVSAGQPLARLEPEAYEQRTT
jgi:[acyl-carrier-protein] S-malonyltransferase